MFITIALLTLALIVYLSIRHWILSFRLTTKSAQKNLREAIRLISVDQWDAAKNILLSLLQNNKIGKEAHLYYLQVLRGTRAYEEALLCVRHVIPLYPEELLFRLEEGKILLELERPEEALEAFNVCAPILRSESDILALGSALLRSGHAAESWALLEKRIDSTKNGPLLCLGAEILFQLNRFSDSITLYHHAIECGYSNHHLLNQLGHSYRRFGNLAEAEAIFRSLLEKDPGDVDATLGLGACMQERGLYQKALLIYQAGHAWDKKEKELIKQAALCALYTKKYAFAESCFAQLVQHRNPTTKILSYYGYSLECQQKWQEAEQTYLQMIKLFPSDASGYCALAWMFGVGLTATLSHDQGIQFANLALSLLPDKTSWDILSACEARLGNFERAVQIQEALLSEEKERESRIRRQEALRRLRKNHPLNDNHVARTLVA